MVKRVGAVLARREETIAGAMEAGADGFLAKDASSRQVAGPSAPLVEGTASVVAEADLKEVR
jgi:DNA-binding NarL/FixJ family response regulator